MQAVHCTQYGAPEVLQLKEVPSPTPKSHEVRIKIYATSVTAADFRIRSFSIPKGYAFFAKLALGFNKPRKPILGTEVAGVIDAVGNKVSKYKVGDPVFALTLGKFGGYAEYVCLNENASIALKPENISFEEAATLPVGALTAQHFIRVAQLTPKHNILIYGASGSVGSFAVQFARLTGAHITGVSSKSNKDMVTALGVNTWLDYNAPDFEQQLSSYDVVFVAVDKLPFEIANRVLKPKGMYINVTSPFKTSAMKKAARLEQKVIVTGKNPAVGIPEMQQLKSLVELGKIITVIDKTFSLQQIVEAHQYVDLGHKKGNVSIKVYGG